jgi:hypothetical protein
VVEIVDTVRKGKNVRVNQKDGITEEHGDMVDRSRLMVDARKWLACAWRIHKITRQSVSGKARDSASASDTRQSLSATQVLGGHPKLAIEGHFKTGHR